MDLNIVTLTILGAVVLLTAWLALMMRRLPLSPNRVPGRRHFDGCGVDLPRNAWRGKVIELLERVGLKADHIDRYPHQYSGQTIFRPLP